MKKFFYLIQPMRSPRWPAPLPLVSHLVGLLRTLQEMSAKGPSLEHITSRGAVDNFAMNRRLPDAYFFSKAATIASI